MHLINVRDYFKIDRSKLPELSEDWEAASLHYVRCHLMKSCRHYSTLMLITLNWISVEIILILIDRRCYCSAFSWVIHKEPLYLPFLLYEDLVRSTQLSVFWNVITDDCLNHLLTECSRSFGTREALSIAFIRLLWFKNRIWLMN